jgi:hypothetical protein
VPRLFRWISLLFLLQPASAQLSWLGPSVAETRAIADAGVHCELKPEPNMSLPIGMPFRVTSETQENATTWYIGYPANASFWCRVDAAHTAILKRSDPDAFALEVIDHVLRRDDASIDDDIAAENYLLGSKAQLTGLLRFRWLQLLDRVLSAENFYRRSEDEPLLRSWLLRHDDQIWYFEPYASWSVRRGLYWEVLDASLSEPWADDAVWATAELDIEHDECEAYCILAGYIGNRVQQYWTRFPAGPHAPAALAEARTHADSIDDACLEDETRQVIADIRGSLTKVTDSAKQPLLDSLARIDNACPPEPR